MNSGESVEANDYNQKENLIEKQKKSDWKPFPVNLNEMKRPLQEEAYSLNISLHANIKRILRLYLGKKKDA
jgi:hypothetical protein